MIQGHIIPRVIFSCVVLYFVPIFMYFSTSPWLAYSYTKNNSIFEYFGFTGFALLMLLCIIERKRLFTFENSSLFIITFILFTFYNILLFSELSRVSHDYLAYESSVKALLSYRSPYSSSSPPYIYPPFLAQSMTLLYRLIRYVFHNLIAFSVKDRELLHLLFYSYQYAQFLILNLSYYLSYLLARKFGLENKFSSVVVFVLFVINTPLYRNFSQNQVNLWILCSILLSFLYISKYPIIAGAALAVGTHIKLYPITQAFAWLISKKWQAIISLIFALFVLFILETRLMTDMTLWVGFLTYLMTVEKGHALRNNSVYSLSFNLSRLLLGGSSANLQIGTILTYAIITAVFIFWILARMYNRKKLSNSDELLYRNMIDALYLMFFISPSVWDHHFVSAIPLVLWSLSKNVQGNWKLVVVSTVLIFFSPTFDVFFFSYVRLVGLILLLYSTPL